VNDTDGAARLDAALVARALAGADRAAFGELVRRHQGTVRAQLLRLTRGDRAWTDDLAQETFLQAWRKLEQFRGDARFSTWLYRIAYTTFLRALRRRPPESATLSEEETGAPDEFRNVALKRDLEMALRELPEAESRAITLCYDFDMSHQDAAYVLGIPVGTVKTHVHRGKARLRERLRAWGDRAEDGTAPEASEGG
jgi:RNA polymerase sigma factor (sigma-70 family)